MSGHSRTPWSHGILYFGPGHGHYKHKWPLSIGMYEMRSGVVLGPVLYLILIKFLRMSGHEWFLPGTRGPYVRGCIGQ